MAELPELETLRRELEKESVGKRFKTPEVVGTKVAKRGGGKKVLQGRLEGAKVKSVDRRGPFLVGNLDTGEMLLLDLGEKGHLEKVAPRSTAPEGHRPDARLHPGRADPARRHERHRPGLRRRHRRGRRGGPGAGRRSGSIRWPIRCPGPRSHGRSWPAA